MSETPNPTNVHRLVPSSGTDLPNPFRAGSMKADCFRRFMRGGDKSTIIADMRALGAAGTTAHNWFYMFRVYSRGLQAAVRQGQAAAKTGSQHKNEEEI